MRLETDADAVKISTVHSCKGLQYGIVFCPFLWDSRDPDKKKECGVLAHTPQGALLDHAQTTEPAHAAQAAREELAERVRRAYVALTRARHRAYVAWGAIGQKSSGAALSALGYLLQTEAVEAGIGDEGNVADFMSAVEPTIGRLVNEHPRLMSLKVLSGEETAGVWRPAAQTAADLTARVFLAGGEERLEPWRMVSYSSLSRARWIEAETPEHADPPLREAAARAATGILAFGQGPRGRALGARTGNCLHAMLERLDFSNPDCPATAALVDEALRNHGLDDPAAHGEGIRPAEVARDMLRAVANNHLPAVTPTFRLSDVAAAQRVTEWPFYLPLDSLRPRDLAGIFRRHAAGAVREEYAPTLRRLTAKRVRGFLTGFVDLVFEHNGRWYVMDWKSNHLGDTADDYAAGPVWRAMVEHHYVLQYHLYVAALDRFLGLRQPRYEYERCFGGVWYVFLRGVDGRSDRGWRYDRPPAALISALGDALHRRAEA
jgi:exodeoxyribonuclease V beta subunit